MRRFASILLTLGVTIGVAGSIGLAIGFRPSQFPAALVDISIYKLVFVAAAAILAAGAVVLRAERRYREREGDSTVRDRSAPGLGSGDPSEQLRRSAAARERERERP